MVRVVSGPTLAMVVPAEATARPAVVTRAVLASTSLHCVSSSPTSCMRLAWSSTRSIEPTLLSAFDASAPAPSIRIAPTWSLSASSSALSSFALSAAARSWLKVGGEGAGELIQLLLRLERGCGDLTPHSSMIPHLALAPLEPSAHNLRLSKRLGPPRLRSAPIVRGASRGVHRSDRIGHGGGRE